MVALAILGMGLLVIAAALPAGAKYTKDSIDQVTGAAAAEYALDLIEQNVCLRDKIGNFGNFGTGLTRPPVLFQPRDPNTALPAPYEPLIKVRPLFVQNIIAASTVAGVTRGTEFFDPTLYGGTVRGQVVAEAAIGQWLNTVAIGGNTTRERDPTQSPGPWLRPSLPSVALVYPPTTADTPHSPMTFLLTSFGGQERMYDPNAVTPSEAAKALDRRIVWTAFYRRVSYAAGSDPTLYEIIVVVSSRPTAGHRFPVQDPATVGQTTSGTYAGIDTLAPIPWLIEFQQLPWPPSPQSFDPNSLYFVGKAPPATLTFTCDPNTDVLLPVGSVFIPARNDYQPPLLPLPNYGVHFGPLASTALPVYEVVQRPDATTVIVKYNGYYPAAGDPTSYNWNPPSAALWPVWVIPPAIESVDASGNPAFSDRSPVLAVTRRYVKLRELP
jgi:hypothetical protein